MRDSIVRQWPYPVAPPYRTAWDKEQEAEVVNRAIVGVRHPQYADWALPLGVLARHVARLGIEPIWALAEVHSGVR